MPAGARIAGNRQVDPAGLYNFHSRRRYKTTQIPNRRGTDKARAGH